MNTTKVKYTIKKRSDIARYYWVLDENGMVVKEFDAYNYQAPYKRAKEWIKEQSIKSK